MNPAGSMGSISRTAREGKGTGTVVISYDDGDTRDFTSAFPIHRRHGVPAEVCIPSSYVDQAGRLTQSELLELQASGWEIVSHTKHHIGLDEVPLARPAAPGDRRLYLRRHSSLKPGSELRVSQGDTSEMVRVADSGEDSRGRYLELEEAVRTAFGCPSGPRALRWIRRAVGGRSAHAVVSVSPAQAREEIVTSRRELEMMGLEVRHFTYPHNRFCEWTRDMVAGSYESARAGRGTDSRLDKVDRYALPSTNFEGKEGSKLRVRRAIDEAAERGGLCMLHAHTRSADFSEDLLETVIVRCLERGLRLRTRSEYFALTRTG